MKTRKVTIERLRGEQGLYYRVTIGHKTHHVYSLKRSRRWFIDYVYRRRHPDNNRYVVDEVHKTQGGFKSRDDAIEYLIMTSPPLPASLAKHRSQADAS